MKFYVTNAELREAAGTFKSFFPLRVEPIVEKAEHACEGEFKLPYTMAAEAWIHHGVQPDWLYNPTEDLEYTWILNRHWHLRDLGIAYLLTNDERYVETYKRHITGWIEQNPMSTSLTYEHMVYFQRPGPWRLLEVGLRVQSWVWSYMMMSHSALLDGDFEKRWRDSLAEQATFLSRYLGETSINHATMHMQGLFMVGTFLADHAEAPYWRQLARERLMLCLHDQIRADGIQNELTPHYHTASLDMFGTPFLLAKQTGRPFPNSYLEKLKSMVAFSVATIRPDGKAVALSDSDSGDQVREKIGIIGAICEDEAICLQGEISEELLWLLGGEKFAYWLERMGGQVEEIPSTLAFPDSGYYVLQDALQYVFFDAAPLGGAHGHADALHVEWMHRGRLIFGDSGRYTYQEGEWRRYFKGTSAHNTITVDGLDQTPYISTQQWGEPEATVTVHRWVSCDTYDFIDASHQGYTRLSEPVIHRRWLLMGKELPFLLIVDGLDGVGTHDIQQLFHLSDDARVMVCGHRGDEVIEAEISYKEEFGKTSGLRMYWAGSAGANASIATTEGWRSDYYGTKQAIPVLAYHQSFTQGAVIATLCLPDGDTNERKAKRLGLLKVKEVEGSVEIQIQFIQSGEGQVAIRVDQQGVSIDRR